MQGRALSRSMLAALIAALGLARSASAQTDWSVNLDAELEQVEDADSSEAIAFEGLVVGPDGVPAEGAVVISSAGGQAVTDRNGRYHLEVCGPIGAKSVQITAVGRNNNQLLASTRVELSAASKLATVSNLTLAQGTTCEPSWLPTFGGEPGTLGTVNALATYDDGNGPALYVAGIFTTIGGIGADHIAKWDGTSWTALGSGLTNNVWALAVYDDGNGPALYAGGGFLTAGGASANRIAKWDGSSWETLGSGVDNVVFALTVYDDGDGPALYAAGRFQVAGGIVANLIAKWDGTAWSALGNGMFAMETPEVRALAVHDDGSGSALYAGGHFETAGLVLANSIAKWDGESWTALGSGVNNNVLSLAVFDDGQGPALYAGGGFTTAGGAAASRIAKWNGASWTTLGSGMDREVRALAVHDDGGGSALYAAGLFTTSGGVGASLIAKWNGTSWTALGSGMSGTEVSALLVHDDGSGQALYAGGEFQSAGGVRALGIAKWSATSWSPIGQGMVGAVSALAVYDDGSGPALHAGGFFTLTPGGAASRIAKWNGSIWSALGSGVNGSVSALAVYDDGGGNALYAGGFFTTAGGASANRIARWDGSSWTTLGSGMNGEVRALTVHDDGGGSALYAGGLFTTAGGTSANRIAKWDGSSWFALSSGVNDVVFAMTVYDDGSGPALHAGGSFTTAGGTSANRVAKWDGTSWSLLGSGIGIGGDDVFALSVHDDGGGAALYAGGNFQSAGGMPASLIAKWDGASWSALGSGLGGLVSRWVFALSSFDDGQGPALYAGGRFTIAGGVAANYVAKWDGTSWSPLGSGVADTVNALLVFDDGGGSALYAGGAFTSAFDSGDSYIAKWGCPVTDPPMTYCTGKTTSAACVPFLSSTGIPSATGGPFNVFSSDHLEGQLGLYLYSFQKANLNFHGGKLCVKTPFQRLSTLIKATDGVACATCAGNCRMFKRNFTQLIQSGVDPLLTPGQTVRVQVRQRDPADPTGFGDNLSNGISFVISP